MQLVGVVLEGGQNDNFIIETATYLEYEHMQVLASLSRKKGYLLECLTRSWLVVVGEYGSAQL